MCVVQYIVTIRLAYIFLTGLIAGSMLADAIMRFHWVYVLVFVSCFYIAGFVCHASAGLIPEDKE